MKKPSVLSPKKRYMALASFSPLLVLGLWILASSSGWIRPVLLPPPMEVVKSFVDMLLNGYSGVSLLQHLMASLYRVGTAFFCGSVLGIAVGDRKSVV